MKTLKVIIAIIVIVLIVIGMVYWTHDRHTIPKNPILFYSHNCPHCEKVDAFLKKTPGVEKYYAFKRVDILKDKANLQKFGTVAKACKLNLNNVPIPLFWTGKRCVHGEKNVINFLIQASGVQ